MKVTKIICDGCGEDLTTSQNGRIDHRLALDVEYVLRGEHAELTLPADKPPLDRSYHFCNLRCLDRWRQENPHVNEA